MVFIFHMCNAKSVQYSLRPCVHACVLSRVWLFVTPQTVACQAPLSVEFSRQEYWSGLSFPPPEDLPDPGIDLETPSSPALQVEFLPLCHLRGPIFLDIASIKYIFITE